MLPTSGRGNDRQTISPDTQHIIEYLEKLQYYSREKNDKDSAVFYQDKAFGLIPADKQGLSFDMLLKIAEHLVAEHNEVGALEYYIHALGMIDRQADSTADDKRKRVMLYQKIAFCQRNYNPEKALAYWQRSIRLAEEVWSNDSTYQVAHDRITVYNNLGAIYSEQGRLDSAEYYYRKAIGYLMPDDSLFTGKLYNNLGVVYARNARLDEAFTLFFKALDYATAVGDSLNLSNIHLNLGKSYCIEGDYLRAVPHLQQSLDISRKKDNLRNVLYTNEQLADIYEQLGKERQALAHLQAAYVLKDSLLDMEKIRSSIDMELGYQYQKQRDSIRHRQEMELHEKEARAVFLLFLTFVLLLLVVLLVVLYRMQRNKARCIQSDQQRLSLQNENLELKKHTLEKELELKQKEVNIHAQYLLKRGEFMTDVINQIHIGKPEQDTELNRILKDIQSGIESSIWNEFKMLFQNLHNDFYVHLYERHPDLTANEKRLCTFIHLNMTSKEISSITQQSVKSIEIARSRLRSKLGLKREDNLCNYLQQF